ncbi:MAG: YeeE/YedE thiosulfate transporter family protein [Gemmatimonadota bacterium]|nr:YeeE/YedE thiosulfate transporter family protein [Gemmatimonadota bacterium]
MAQSATQAPPASSVAAGSSGVPAWAKFGVIFGVVGALSILTWGPIGVSGTYPRFIGAIMRRLAPDMAHANPYLEKMGSLIKPETFLLLGLLIGGFLAAKLTGDKAAAAEYPHAGEKTTARRYRDAFIGGFLIVFGARIAGGCTSGHIISGIMQLSVSGLIFAGGVFATGILTAKLLQKGGN